MLLCPPAALTPATEGARGEGIAGSRGTGIVPAPAPEAQGTRP